MPSTIRFQIYKLRNSVGKSIIRVFGRMKNNNRSSRSIQKSVCTNIYTITVHWSYLYTFSTDPANWFGCNLMSFSITWHVVISFHDTLNSFMNFIFKKRKEKRFFLVIEYLTHGCDSLMSIY